MKTSYQLNLENMKKTVPSMAYNGGELSAWQYTARQKLADLLGMDRFERTAPELIIESEQRREDATEIRFSFQSETGYRVPCCLLLPHGIVRPPLMICLQGHSTGMHISLGIPMYPGDAQTIAGNRDFCLRAVKEGFAALAMEQRNFGVLGGNENGLPQCFESSMTALLMGRTTIGERLWDLSRAIDLIETEFADRVDASAICCMGNSGGGTVTAYAAALEERIVLAMPSCAMCTYRDSIGAMMHCSCNYVPRIADFFDMGDLMAMAYPKYFVQVSGKEDGIFPLFGAREVFEKGKNAYAACDDAEKCTLVVGNGGHRFYADDAWPVVHAYLHR